MHGLINKSIESFVCSTYGLPIWHKIAAEADLDAPHFEAMLVYDSQLTPRIVDAAVRLLDADRADFLQNLGIFLISHPVGHGIRRLLRFGGVTFVDFLYSLDDLHDRAKLAVSDLELPSLELREYTPSQFSVTVSAAHAGFGHVLVGLLTAMADDYGALVMIEYGGRSGQIETVAIALLETAFTEGNRFELGQASA